MQELSVAERAAVQWAVGLSAVGRSNAGLGTSTASWRYRSVGELLVDLGRLFTPGPALERMGPAKQCYANASARADSHAGEVYVEGLASTGAMPGLSLEHAWCAMGTEAIDPTWAEGGAYLGIAFAGEYRRQRQNDTGYDSLLWSPAVLKLLPEGLPAGAVAEVGRLIPTELVTALERAMVSET